MNYPKAADGQTCCSCLSGSIWPRAYAPRRRMISMQVAKELVGGTDKRTRMARLMNEALLRPGRASRRVRWGSPRGNAQAGRSQPERASKSTGTQHGTHTARLPSVEL